MVRWVLVLVFGLAMASPLRAQVNPEFAVAAADPSAETAPAASVPKGLGAQLEFAVGAQTLGSDDLDDTYGLLPGGSVGMSWPLRNHTRFHLTAGYYTTGGDLYYDTPEFASDQRARLRAVPLTFGLRENLTPGSRTGLVGGLAIQIAWIEEELPAGTNVTGHDVNRGYGIGILASLGPRWCSRDERRALGVELAVGGCGADIGEGRGKHEVDLTGFHLRAYWSMQLGGTTRMEVQR